MQYREDNAGICKVGIFSIKYLTNVLHCDIVKNEA